MKGKTPRDRPTQWRTLEAMRRQCVECGQALVWNYTKHRLVATLAGGWDWRCGSAFARTATARRTTIRITRRKRGTSPCRTMSTAWMYWRSLAHCVTGNMGACRRFTAS